MKRLWIALLILSVSFSSQAQSPAEVVKNLVVNGAEAMGTFRAKQEEAKETKLMQQFSDLVPYGDEVYAYVRYRESPLPHEVHDPATPLEVLPFDPSYETPLEYSEDEHWERKTVIGTGRANARPFLFERVADDPAHQKYMESEYRHRYPELFGELSERPKQLVIRAPTTFEAPMEGSKFKAWYHFLDTVYNYPQALSVEDAKISVEGQKVKTPASQPGGVLMNGVLTALFETDDIVAASVDPEHDEVLLIGKQRTSVLSMPLDPDYLTVALRAAVLKGEWLAVSIDPSPDPHELKVSYYGGAENTTVGQVMFEADRMLKVLSMRWDNETNTPFEDASKIVNKVPDLWPRPTPSDWTKTCETYSRFWITPAEMNLGRSSDKLSVRFVKASMQVKTELMSPTLGEINDDNWECVDRVVARNEKFATKITEHYDVLARKWPLLEELRQIAKTVNLVQWLLTNTGIDQAVMARNPRETFTPLTTPARELIRIEVDPPRSFISMLRGGVELTGRPFINDNPQWVDAFARAAKESRPQVQWRANAQVVLVWLIAILAGGVMLLVMVTMVVHERDDNLVSCLFACGAIYFTYTYSSTHMESFFPSRIDPVWSFAYEDERYLAFALPASEFQANGSHSSMPRSPLIWQSTRVELDPNAKGVVRVSFKSRCEKSVGLRVDGEFVGDLLAGATLARVMLPGHHALSLDNNWQAIELKPSYRSVTYTISCGQQDHAPSSTENPVLFPPIQPAPVIQPVTFPTFHLTPDQEKAWEECKRRGLVNCPDPLQ